MKIEKKYFLTIFCFFLILNFALAKEQDSLSNKLILKINSIQMALAIPHIGIPDLAEFGIIAEKKISKTTSVELGGAYNGISNQANGYTIRAGTRIYFPYKTYKGSIMTSNNYKLQYFYAEGLVFYRFMKYIDWDYDGSVDGDWYEIYPVHPTFTLAGFKPQYIADEYRYVYALGIIIGKETKFGKHFVVDRYCGLGIRKRKKIIYESCYYRGDTHVCTPTDIILHENKIYPTIQFGIKIGYQF